MKPSEIVCCVVDLGLFSEIARTLAKTYKKVYLYVPWEQTAPSVQTAFNGHGIPEIELTSSPYKVMDEVDLWVFPDVCHGPFQEWLAKEDRLVWGGRSGEDLEFKRDKTKEMMLELGLPVGPYEVIKGLTALRRYLKDYPRKHVKVSKYRGDFETFFSENYRLSEFKLDEIQNRLGPIAEELDYIVEGNLPSRFEIGIDAYSIDGVFPEKLMYGIEVKDVSYIGYFDSYANIPEPITEFSDAIAPHLKEIQYRGFYSHECRINKNGNSMMIDACMRAASPPNELYQVCYENLAEIILEGAQGNCITPKPLGKWGAQIQVYNANADTGWTVVDFPEDFEDYVKLRNPVRHDGMWHVSPQHYAMPVVASAVGIGNSMQEAVEMAKEVADSIRGHGIHVPDGSLAKAEEEIDKAVNDFGIPIFGRKPK